MSPLEKLERQEAVDFALASVRLEGLEPSPEKLAKAGRFVAGEIDSLTGKKCPCCGADELFHGTRDVPYQSHVIPAVTGDFCDACGEFILDADEGNRYGKHIGQFQREGHVARMLASFRLEGIEPDEADRERLAAYVEGTMTADDLLAHARTYADSHKGANIILSPEFQLRAHLAVEAAAAKAKKS